MKKLRILLGFSKLMVVEPLTAIALNMRNFIAFVAGIPGICKDFAANRANEHENVHRGGGTLPSGRLRHEKSRIGRLFSLAVVDPHGFAVVVPASGREISRRNAVVIEPSRYWEYGTIPRVPHAI